MDNKSYFYFLKSICAPPIRRSRTSTSTLIHPRSGTFQVPQPKATVTFPTTVTLSERSESNGSNLQRPNQCNYSCSGSYQLPFISGERIIKFRRSRTPTSTPIHPCNGSNLLPFIFGERIIKFRRSRTSTSTLIHPRSGSYQLP